MGGGITAGYRLRLEQGIVIFDFNLYYVLLKSELLQNLKILEGQRHFKKIIVLINSLQRH